MAKDKDIPPNPPAAKGGSVRAAIELTAPHTHAGRDYPAGTTLVLADVELHPESAQWLVTLHKARWAGPAETPTDTTGE